MPSGKFDMYMRQVSRPRPRRDVPIGWPEEIRRRQAGPRHPCTSLVVHKGWPLVLPCTSKVERGRAPRKREGTP